MKRFLVSEKLVAGARFRLSPEESKHATRVMRLEVGAKMLLTDGLGHEAEAELLDTSKEGALIVIHGVHAMPERPFRFELLQATLKGSRMDWLVEKATELGVDSIRVIETQYSVAGEKPERWARLAHAALKQSGNLRMPVIHECIPLADAMSRLPQGFHGFLLSPDAQLGLAEEIKKSMPKGEGNAILAIGPEGGFSADEEKLLESRGFRPCRLSAQILRGETAALTAAAIALHALEFSASSGL